jgi:hypothetical protein
MPPTVDNCVRFAILSQNRAHHLLNQLHDNTCDCVLNRETTLVFESGLGKNVVPLSFKSMQAQLVLASSIVLELASLVALRNQRKLKLDDALSSLKVCGACLFGVI